MPSFQGFTVPNGYNVGLIKPEVSVRWKPVIHGNSVIDDGYTIEADSSSFNSRLFYYRQKQSGRLEICRILSVGDMVKGWANNGWCYVSLEDFEKFTSNDVGFVYFIEAEGLSRYKIGYTNNPIRRLEEFNKACPCTKLILRALSPLTPYYKQIESKWHKRLARHRVHGEWFNLADPVSFMVAGNIALGFDLSDIPNYWIFESWDEVLCPNVQISRYIEDLNQFSIALEKQSKEDAPKSNKDVDVDSVLQSIIDTANAYNDAIQA